MDSSEPLHDLLSRAAWCAERRLTEASFELGLTPAGERILRALPLDGATTAAALAAALEMNRSMIRRGLRRLERNGCVQLADVASDPHDLRLRPVRLSGAGRALWRCVAADPDPLPALLTPPLDRAPLGALRRGLHTIAALAPHPDRT